jgi:hypothetical protein
MAETRLEPVVAACYRRAGWMPGNHEYVQQRALLDDLEFTDLRVAGEQCEMEGMDGDLTAVAGGEGEDVVAAAVDGLHPGEHASARTGIGVESDQVGATRCTG